MNAFSRIKRTATVLFAAVAFAVSGVPAAHAVDFDYLGNSAALAIFGGDSEYIVQLGNISTLTSGGPSVFNIPTSAIAAVSTNLGAGGLKWALLGYSFDATYPGGFFKTASGTASGNFSTNQVNQWQPGLVAGPAVGWVNELNALTVGAGGKKRQWIIYQNLRN